MMTVQVLAGASLFALLIVDICCLPVKTGFGPGASLGGSHINAAPSFDLYQGAPSGHSSAGSDMPNYGSSGGVSTQYYQAAPRPMASVPQSGVPAQPGAAFQSGVPAQPGAAFQSGVPAQPGAAFQSGVPAQPGAAFQSGVPAQPGAAIQSAPREVNWAVAPLSLTGNAEMSTGVHGPSALPPGPMYQAGDLSHFEQSFEHGNSERETEEQGWLPPPPPHMPAYEESTQGLTSQPGPESNVGGSWGPYPYYDYMFLTGQYPAGTYTHASSSFEQGRDHSQEDHYERYQFTYMPVPEPQRAPVKAPVKAPPKTPVQAPVAQTGSHGGFGQRRW